MLVYGELLIYSNLHNNSWRLLILLNNNPVPLKDGAFNLLNHLSSKCIPIAVATSSKTDRAVEKLPNAGILDLLNIVVRGDQVKHSKPYPDIFLKAVEFMDVNPEKCLALEDSKNGVPSAVAAGMTGIQIPDLAHPSQYLIGLGHTILNNIIFLNLDFRLEPLRLPDSRILSFFLIVSVSRNVLIL